jgi:hypothetical protein
VAELYLRLQTELAARKKIEERIEALEKLLLSD